MALHGPTTRPLPQAPVYNSRDRDDVTWAEIQEKAYQPAYQYQQPLHTCYNPAAKKLASPTNGSGNARWGLPPTSPASMQRQQQYPFLATPAPAPMLTSNRHSQPGLVRLTSREQQQQQQGMFAENMCQRPRPSHLNSAPSRFQSSKDAYRPFAFDEEDEVRRTGMANGSAFMHKGFFDIMSLVNSQGSPSRVNGNGNNAGGGFKATFGKATGRFRKTNTTMAAQVATNGVSNEDPFFSSPAPQMMFKTTAPLAVLSPNKIYLGNAISPSASLATQLGGPRAQKKRISVDMIGAPCINTFVHAAHASDAEQAEEILKRWSRDGVGKIADPAWIHRCKEAMRVQAARNQAEAIAEVQAALHQDSFLVENPRTLQIMNGAPSPSLTGTASAMTSLTGATAGHSNLFFTESAVESKRPAFQGIDEEENPTPPQTPRRVPLPGESVQTPRIIMMPRTNTQGTIFIAQSPEPASMANQATPDYLSYQPAELQDKRSSKTIDGLPGGVDSINALFNRPPSVVVRDNNIALNLIQQELDPSSIAANAGPTLQPSLTTVEKSVAAKIFFENLYYGILKKPRDRDTRKAGLERELASLRIPESAKNDIRVAWAANESEYLRDLRSRVTANSFIRLKTIGHGAFGVVALVKERETSGLFAMKQLRKADMLRKGQEGHVRAERDLMTSASASTRAKWIVKLIYSFQDVDHLYLIMEFMGGGDLLNLLIEKDIFEEDFSRFYVAEMILAINEAHRLGYIHRDIKPDNFLFTSQGHIKLADFGLCQSFHWAHDGAYYDQQRKNMLRKHGIDLEDSAACRAWKGGMAGMVSMRQHQPGNGKLDERELNEIMSDRNEDGTPVTHVLTWRDKNKKKIAYSVVGTNNYMAPEVLRGHGYDQSCDWWSLGVIIFEMLYGFPPFVSKSRQMTRQKILNWKQTLRFPPKPKISREAQDLITRLICEKDDRLGSTSSVSVSRPNSLLQGNRQPSGFATMYGGADGSKVGLQDGVDDLMAHPWFRGIEWDRIHTTAAPFKPDLSHAADTKHFEDDIEAETLQSPAAAEAIKDGKPIPVDTPRDPMLRDKDHGQQLLEVRKNLAFVGYTFQKSKGF